MKTFEQFVNEMITVGISKHPSKPGHHIISVKHASSMPTQFPHERVIPSHEVDAAVAKMKKYYGDKINFVKYHH